MVHAAVLEEVGAVVLADDPKALRGRIAELERELREKTPSAVDEGELRPGRVSLVGRDHADR